MFDHAHPLGFLASSKALDAEAFIGETEALVSSLVSTEADLTPAEEALRAARSLHAARAYSKAVAQARRAAALALTLAERFNAYVSAWKALQVCREELEAIGYPSDVLEAALDAADREVVRTVPEDDTVVPNYAGATALLERAMEETRAIVTRAREASQEIFLATLAVESLSESPSVESPSWLGIRLEEMIEQATHALATGDAASASRIAAEARARADSAIAGNARTQELLDMTAAILDGLEAEGPAAIALAEQVASAREALGRGFLDRATASVLARRLSDDVAAFARQYPRARGALEHADRVYAKFREDGFRLDEVDAALAEARCAVGAGEWATVRAKIGRASEIFVRLRMERERLNRAIAEIEERVALLKGFRLPLLVDVEELLGRAKGEVRTGRLPSAHEDVVLAGTLMLQATRTGS